MWHGALKKEIEENEFLINQIEDDFVKQKVRVNMEWYITKAVKNKYYFYCLSSLTVIAPVLAEIVLLLPVGEHYTRFLTGIFVGVSTIAASFLSLFEVKNKWKLYRNQSEKLKGMLSTYSADKEGFLEKMEKSMEETHEMWKKIFEEELKG